MANGKTDYQLDSKVMRSGRIGLSEYTTQRLAELQALRLASEANDSPVGRKQYYSISKSYVRDDEPRSLPGESRDSEESAASPPESGEVQSPSITTTKVVLPSAILESKRRQSSSSSSRVGYQSLALPPDGSYRPLRSSIYTGQTQESYSWNTGTENNEDNNLDSVTETEMILPSRMISRQPDTSHRKTGTRSEEETKQTTMSLGRISQEKTSLAVKTDDGCIGFAKLPDQVHRKAIKRGFDFTLMVVGESGLGKSTLISSMFFQNDFYKDRTIPGATEKLAKTVLIEKRQLEIEERGVRLRLTVIDTPGFNDSINSTDCWKTVDKYIQDQFAQYFNDESGLNRQTIQDHRVHCCLYFISPYGRGLRPVDVDFMKRLQHRVNIVPIIAKADTFTSNELKKLKAKIMEEIHSHKIQIYELPQIENDEDEDFKRKDKELKAAYPFAVIGGNAVIEVDGRRVKGRVYPWGIVEAENPEYSDVSLLRQFLVSTHLHDLKEVTKDLHYENYRAGVIDQKAKSLPPTSIPKKAEADKLLKEKEEEIRRMHMMLQKMQSQMQSSYAR